MLGHLWGTTEIIKILTSYLLMGHIVSKARDSKLHSREGRVYLGPGISCLAGGYSPRQHWVRVPCCIAQLACMQLLQRSQSVYNHGWWSQACEYHFTAAELQAVFVCEDTLSLCGSPPLLSAGLVPNMEKHHGALYIECLFAKSQSEISDWTNFRLLHQDVSQPLQKSAAASKTQQPVYSGDVTSKLFDISSLGICNKLL